MPDNTETLFEVSLARGMADRHRLPLQHVIDVLRQLQEAVREVGKVIQRDRGLDETGDFGLELLADSDGVVFQKNGVKATAAITRNVRIGVEAVRVVMKTAASLERKRPTSIDERGEIVVRHLVPVADIQRQDKTELKLALITPKKREDAVYGERGIETMEAIAATESAVHGLTLYGRLRQLVDRSKKEEGGKYFWGELLTDGGDVWRVKFNARRDADAINLFRKRVVVEGDAIYRRTTYPRLDVSSVKEEATRDYLAAFNDLYGCDSEVYGKENFDALIAEMRGDT